MDLVDVPQLLRQDRIVFARLLAGVVADVGIRFVNVFEDLDGVFMTLDVGEVERGVTAVGFRVDRSVVSDY